MCVLNHLQMRPPKAWCWLFLCHLQIGSAARANRRDEHRRVEIDSKRKKKHSIGFVMSRPPDCHCAWARFDALCTFLRAYTSRDQRPSLSFELRKCAHRGKGRGKLIMSHLEVVIRQIMIVNSTQSKGPVGMRGRSRNNQSSHIPHSEHPFQTTREMM
jgi:hypothetical protein